MQHLLDHHLPPLWPGLLAPFSSSSVMVLDFLFLLLLTNSPLSCVLSICSLCRWHQVCSGCHFGIICLDLSVIPSLLTHSHVLSSIGPHLVIIKSAHAG